MLKPFRSSESKLMVTTVLETSDSAPASAWLLSCGPLHLGPTCCCCQLSKSVYCCSLFSSQFSKTCWEENYPCSNTHMLVIMYWRPLLICYLLGVCFASIAEEGFLISSCYSLELCIQMFICSFSSIKWDNKACDILMDLLWEDKGHVKNGKMVPGSRNGHTCVLTLR